jgi:uncharacterized DUF497 family protein
VSRYDWDPVKAEANWRKHGVAFEEAAEMLDGDRFYERPDVQHSLGEDRVRTIGFTPTGSLIVVITSVSGPRPRIISARRATKREHDDHVGG